LASCSSSELTAAQAPDVTKAQRDAVTDILGHLFPVRWKSFEVGQDMASL
jgi:hypothetical protein